MKAIMISDKPKWCALMMNGIKTKEIRKKALADAVQKLIDEYGYAEIYVYCSKDQELFYELKHNERYYFVANNRKNFRDRLSNGLVVFKFRCYKVEEIPSRQFSVYHFPYTKTLDDYELLSKSCLTTEELDNYLGYDKTGYALDISDLEIFDKPKELWKFKRHVFYTTCKKCPYNNDKYACEAFGNCHEHIPLTKAPQNFVYIESEEK